RKTHLPVPGLPTPAGGRSEEHTSELQSRENLVCRLLLEKKKKKQRIRMKTRTKKSKRAHPGDITGGRSKTTSDTVARAVERQAARFDKTVKKYQQLDEAT